VPSAFARRLAAIGYLATAERIANDHEVTLDAIGSRSRRAPVARARRTLMLALRNLGLKYEAIGIIMARDHSTVVFQVRAAADPTYRERRRAA
jgi:chromosomal replication initiation ATPase DnaA